MLEIVVRINPEFKVGLRRRVQVGQLKAQQSLFNNCRLSPDSL